MTTAFDRPLGLLDEAQFTPPPDLGSALEGLPPAGALPDPHEAWALIALVDHGERKRRRCRSSRRTWPRPWAGGRGVRSSWKTCRPGASCPACPNGSIS